MSTSPPILPVYEVPEWKTQVIAAASLSEGDRRLANELAQGEGGRLAVEELRSGVRVIAKSWVGVVRFESFEVRVVPKLAGGNFGMVKMIEFATGLDALRRNSGARKLDIQGANLFDLIALLLAEHCEYLLRGGLLADYVETEDELAAVRGRILADKQMLKKFGRIDRLICRFDEQEQDVLENQILAAALDKCAPTSIRSRNVSSLHWMSSKTTASGRSAAACSSVLRKAQAISSADVVASVSPSSERIAAAASSSGSRSSCFTTSTTGQ